MSTSIPRLPCAGDGVTAAAARAGAILAAGGVIAAPTETVYGLMCRWDCLAARQRLIRMKGRAPEKHLQMLAESLDAAAAVGLVVDARLRCLAEAFWPGPLTAVGATADGGSIGLRLPRHAFVQALLRSAGGPLAASSANRAGQPPALDAAAAVAELFEAPDLLVDGGTVVAGGQASTVVDVSAPDTWRLLRVGPIDLAALRAVLGDPVDTGA